LVEWKKFNADTATAEYELYDYDEDPLETKNLAADQPDVVQSLAELLASHPEAKPKAK
jgi:iduronate 2-sulfatase